MLSGGVTAPFDRAFVSVTAFPLEEQLDAFSSAQAAHWASVSCHFYLLVY
jgi:hypothetical protein